MIEKPIIVSNELVRAIGIEQPGLTELELVGVVEKLTEQIGVALSNGYSLAFMKQKPDGDVELRVLNIEFPEKAW